MLKCLTRLSGGALGAWAGLFLLASPVPCGADIQEIYIIQLTHLDIGFTAPPDDVAEECKAEIDQVLGFLDTYPQFKWTIESVWQLDQWLQRTQNPGDVQRLFDYVRAGRISIGAGYGNMHSSMLGHEEMNRLFYPAHRLRVDQGVEITTMLMDDVPGWSWAIPQAAARSGVRYFLAGPNTWIGGAAEIPMADRPFYYQGPDGSRILAWRGYSHYLEGSYDYLLHSRYSDMEEAFLARIGEWEAAGYPYDAILVLDGTGDNGMADRALEVFDNVDQWNANHAIRMILATPEEFFGHMEEAYPGAFPVYSGDSAGLWEAAGNCATPVSQAMVRVSGDRVLDGEKLATVNWLNGGSYAGAGIDSIFGQNLTSDEHSGAGAPWPGLLTLEEVDRTNAYFFGIALVAYAASESLVAGELDVMGRGLGLASPAVVVFNPLSWDRSDIVRARLPGQVYEGDFVLRDGGTQEEIPYDKIGDRTIEFFASAVPSVGYKVYIGEAVPEEPIYPDRVISSDGGRTLENDFYRVSVRSSGLSIWDKELGRELVNQGSEFAFNGLIRATNGQDFFGLSHLLPFGAATVSGQSGPVSGEMTLEFESLAMSRAEIVLYGDVKRIDVIDTIDQGRMPFVPYEQHSDHYSVTFPFALDVTGGFQALIENPNRLIRPDADYLPGALIGNFVSQHAIDLREASGFGVTFANRESFLNEIGGPFHHNTEFAPEEATLVNKVVQKVDQGDTIDQGIVTLTSIDHGIEISEFRYAITSSLIPPDSASIRAPVETVRFGWGFDHPLEAVFERGRSTARGRMDPIEASLFSLSHDNVILVAAKKATFSPESDVIFRLQEIAGIPSDGVVLQSAFPFADAEVNTVTEKPVSGGTLPTDPIVFDIGPYETLTIRARQ